MQPLPAMVRTTDGEMLTLPDELAEQYLKCCYPRDGSFKEDHPCARLSGRLVRWCWDNGYPEAKVVLFSKAGAADHALAVVEIDTHVLFFDLTAGTVKTEGPIGWEHLRDVFRNEVIHAPEWQ